MNKDTEKYRINEFLDRLTVREYKFAMKAIPELLDVSMNTFHNYRRIKVGEKQDVPYEKIKLMEILFGVKSGELENEKMHGKSLSELFKAQSSR